MAKNIWKISATLATGVVIAALSTPASAIDVGAGVSIGGRSGVSAGLGASAGGSRGISAGLGASVGGGNGVNAGAGANIGGSGGVNAGATASIGGSGGVNAGVGAGVGDGVGVGVGVGIGGPSNPGTPGTPGNPGTPGTPDIPGVVSNMSPDSLRAPGSNAARCCRTKRASTTIWSRSAPWSRARAADVPVSRPPSAGSQARRHPKDAGLCRFWQAIPLRNFKPATDFGAWLELIGISAVVVKAQPAR